METVTELRGTTICPICGYGEPHSHTPSEVAERPYIDGARVAFEKDAHEFMRRDYFKGARTGFWWGFDAEQARRSDEWEPVVRKQHTDGRSATMLGDRTAMSLSK